MNKVITDILKAQDKYMQARIKLEKALWASGFYGEPPIPTPTYKDNDDDTRV